MKLKKLSKSFTTIFLVIVAFFLLRCDIFDWPFNPDKPTPKKHWSYDGDTGPDHWGELDPDYADCSDGQNQSPIDIVTTTAIKSDLSDIQFHYEASELEIENNGHAIEAIPHSGSYIEIDNIRYDLLQFHFHSLSEHTVNGDHFPIEGHFVHINADGALAVIGLFIEPGTENQDFKPIWDHLPAHEGDVFDLHTQINANDLLPTDRRSYQYSGSLTTPSCSEGVKWFVLAVPAEMSQAQIDALEAIYDHNYRPVQALNARQVLFDTTN
jgi:carbonic anhydrase